MTTFANPSPTDDMLPDEIAALRGESAPAAEVDLADDDAPVVVADDHGADDTLAVAATPETEPEVTEAPAQALPAQPAEFEVEAKDYAAERLAIRTEKKELLTKWSDGGLSDEEYAAAVDLADEKLSTLVAEQTRAATLADINAQNARAAAQQVANAENAAMQAVALASKSAGQIDYGTDTVACAQFDALHQAAKLDPANATLTAQQVAQKAHAAVLAIRGIAAPAATAQTAKAKPVIPQTLANLPAAAATPMGNDLANELMGMDPDEAEARWASMSAAKREQELRSTLPASRRRVQ